MRIPLFIAIGIALLLASCTIQKRVYMAGYHIEWKAFAKASPQRTKPVYTGYSLNAYNALSTKPSQESIISAEAPETIYGPEGTIVEFPADAFVYENGGRIRCTQVAVYLTEFYALSDMVASGLTTSDNKRALASAGMVYIEARCHGEKLRLKPGKRVTIKMPAFPADRSMKAFSGKLKDGIIDWTVDGKLRIDNFQDGGAEGDGSGEGAEGPFRPEGEYQETYIMSMTKLGWINCDRFYETPNPTRFLVRADSVANTFVALIFHDMKSVLPGYQLANYTTEFSGIPAGASVTILAYRINEKSKEVMVGRQEITVGENKAVQLAMQLMAVTDFKAMLREFD